MNPAQLIGNPPPRIPEPANTAPAPEAVPTTPPVLTIEPVTTRRPKRDASAVMPGPTTATPASLADDMAALSERLARSLNVAPNARGGYDASAFVVALEAVHARFVTARASLSEWEATLEAREQKLAKREHDLSDAEDRASAALRLAKLMPEAQPVKPSLKRWFWR